MAPITSLQNPRVKALVRLRERRERDSTRKFLIEGYREISRALEGSIEVETLFTCPALYLGSNEPALVASAESLGAEVMELGEAAFRKVAYRDRPEGLVAEARQFPTGLDRLQVTEGSLWLAVEGIEKPGNLGTMLRTADAAGAAGVIVCDPTTDPFNPNVVRASIGCLFSVPLAVASTPDVIGWFDKHDVLTVATTPDTSKRLWDTDLTGTVALAIGSEQYGLSDRWLGAADVKARIPMRGSADSLNAAMAAGIVMFEAVRQRSTG